MYIINISIDLCIFLPPFLSIHSLLILPMSNSTPKSAFLFPKFAIEAADLAVSV